MFVLSSLAFDSWLNQQDRESLESVFFICSEHCTNKQSYLHVCLHESASVYCCVSELFVSVCVRDKAGGYGIQALGGMLVECVHGDFLNVVGFPLNHFCKQMDSIHSRYLSSSNQESVSVHTHSTQPTPKPPAPSSTRPDLSSKHSPSASQTQPTQSSPSTSPVIKVCFSHPMSTICYHHQHF